MSIYLIRHAQACDRERWDGHDGERPLSRKGHDRAEAIRSALRTARIARVLSSPALRCQQTVAPLAARLGLAVEPLDLLAEGASAAPARALLEELARADGDTVLCGHGDLIPELVDTLAAAGIALRGKGCAKGSVWELSTDGGRIVSGVYHREPSSLTATRA